jgi:hypothetical protein
MHGDNKKRLNFSLILSKDTPGIDPSQPLLLWYTSAHMQMVGQRQTRAPCLVSVVNFQ